MPVLDPEEEGKKFPFDPQSFLRNYGIPLHQPQYELTDIGGQTYVSHQMLGFIEDLLIEFDGFWGSKEAPTHIDYSGIENENNWCIDNLGHIPKAQLYETKTWFFFKGLLNRSRDTLYQEICVEMRYCENKDTLSRLSLLSTIAKIIEKFAGEEVEALPLPEEILTIYQIVTSLLSVFLLLTGFLKKLCQCE